MSQLIHKAFWCWSLTTALVLVGQPNATKLFAADTAGSSSSDADQDDGRENQSIEIEPYTGPPIYLDEPDTPPPAQIVERQTATDKYPDGKLRWERQVAKYSDDRYVADGFYREFYPNEKLFVEGTYKSGRQDGEWQYWHENGQLNRKVMYKSGRPEGAWETYRTDGTLVSKTSYSNGKRDGEWIIYDKTGEKPLREERYEDGKAHGEWKQWFPSGQMQRQVVFKEGMKDGLAAEWREDGSKMAEMNYKDGKPDGTATLWSPDGRTFIQHYEDGKLVSEEAHK